MTMSKFKPQRPGSRPGYDIDRWVEQMHKIKHEAHCPLYSPSNSSSDSDSSSLSFKQEYYQMMKHKHESRNKNRPRHRSTSPKGKGMTSPQRRRRCSYNNIYERSESSGVSSTLESDSYDTIHRRKPPRNVSKVAPKARSSSARPVSRPDTHLKRNKRRSGSEKPSSSNSSRDLNSYHEPPSSHYKPNQRGGNFRKRHSSSGTSSSSGSGSQQNYSNFKQSPRRSNKRRSPSYSSSSKSSHDSSCPSNNNLNNLFIYGKPSGYGRASGKDMVPLRDKSQKKHKPGCFAARCYADGSAEFVSNDEHASEHALFTTNDIDTIHEKTANLANKITAKSMSERVQSQDHLPGNTKRKSPSPGQRGSEEIVSYVN
ncbi:hypothetical protein ACTXT7_011343 [Hymenolepis weldensis]